jgi:primosomal protein N' (replication factor Y)
MERITLFADLILPLPLNKLFTYRVPYELNEYIKVGARVLVQFGKRRVLTAVVTNLHETRPEYSSKYILELLDEEPVVSLAHLKFWEWIANYYMCTVGDVMGGALPAGMKLSNTSKIQLHPHFDLKESLLEFNFNEQKLLKTLQNVSALSHDEVADLLQVKNVYDILKFLIKKQVLIIYDEVKEKYKPKIAKKIRLTKDYLIPEKLQKLIGELEKYQKQQQIILKYLSKVPIQKGIAHNKKGIQKVDLLASREGNKLSMSSLKTLQKKGVFEEFSEVIPRFPILKTHKKVEINLTPAQNTALNEILEHYQSKNVALLHGLTGSGKTEIYVQLINQALESGSQVLLLLPEIALTTQMVIRLKKIFGDKMGVYHSRFSDNERVEVWQSVRSGDYDFVVGVRSAIFLPFDNLGLIIVDEEHDTSYKQHEPAPRYNARDLAMVLAKMQGAKVLLGSATPSVESYYLAKKGVYGLVNLTQRYGDAQLPEIVAVDIAKSRKEKRMQLEFSPELMDEIRGALTREEQIILFQNRRGYAPLLHCQVCEWIPKCQNCAVSLTYHLRQNEVRCHYCGYAQKTPNICLDCGSTKIKTMRFGTQKLEDDLKLLIPNVRIQRMDKDTTRNKSSYEQIIQSFENHEVDILVGTQMLSKGLDFKRVHLVGVFDCDRMLHFPDFRAFERVFQLVTQVSGRAGRRGKQGKVIIQTNNPSQLILKRIIENDYLGFYEGEVLERERHLYPPFARLIKIVVKHENEKSCFEAAKALAKPLKKRLGAARVLGPEAPLINRIRNKFLQEIMIKLEREKVNLKAVKQFIAQEVENFYKDKKFKNVWIVLNVDPV